MPCRRAYSCEQYRNRLNVGNRVSVVASADRGRARNARAVFNGEPGRPTGNVVTGRKGALFLDIEVTGKAAHSGVNHRDGVSAIEALCRKVSRLHALTDYASGTTVTMGRTCKRREFGSSRGSLVPDRDRDRVRLYARRRAGLAWCVASLSVSHVSDSAMKSPRTVARRAFPLTSSRVLCCCSTVAPCEDRSGRSFQQGP
jgi:hypothetical protein